MSRPVKVILLLVASLALAAFASACGTKKISVAQTDPTHRGAVLFSERCSGCHTLSYAATEGSASNVRTAMINNGPNFNVRCERPVTRVLYAIENGGFSGAIMPQNIVVGQDARDVAEFVSKYAGRQAPNVPGAQKCDQQSIGTLPPANQTATQAAATTPASQTTATKTSSSKTGSGKNGSGKSGKTTKTTTQTTTTR